jgi:hypothetical protein
MRPLVLPLAGRWNAFNTYLNYIWTKIPTIVGFFVSMMMSRLEYD